MGCLNHNLTHATSEKPSELPTYPVTVRPSKQAGLTYICLPVTVEHAEILYMCIKQIFYKYKCME